MNGVSVPPAEENDGEADHYRGIGTDLRRGNREAAPDAGREIGTGGGDGEDGSV